MLLQLITESHAIIILPNPEALERSFLRDLFHIRVTVKFFVNIKQMFIWGLTRQKDIGLQWPKKIDFGEFGPGQIRIDLHFVRWEFIEYLPGKFRILNALF